MKSPDFMLRKSASRVISYAILFTTQLMNASLSRFALPWQQVSIAPRICSADLSEKCFSNLSTR